MRAQKPGQSALLLLDAVELLRREGIDYLVIGAFALSVHGVIRATTDVDALLRISARRLVKLQAQFADAGFNATLRRGDTDDPIPGLLVLSDRFGNQVDLLGGLRGLDPKTHSRAVDVPFIDSHLRIVGREDFIAMKCFAGGPQDVLVARAAYEAAPGPLDIDLLRSVTRRLGRAAADRLEDLLSG